MFGGNRRRGAVGVLSLGAVAALLAGCAASPAPEPEETPDPPEYVSDYEAPPATAIAPLTGAVVPAGSLGTPSLAAKIDNHVEARPQVGLWAADLVFEELVEGGLTRYVGVWQSNVPAEIGPVRSIRPMDPDIISPLGGIVAYSGGQQRFVTLMRAAPVYNAIHGQSDTAETFFRTPSKRSPHNVLVKATELIAEHGDLAAPQQLWSFADTAANCSACRDGAPQGSVALVFGEPSHPSWTFDGTAGTWIRAQSGVADLDDRGQQLAAVNLIVLRVPIGNDGGVPKTQLIGAGEAWVAAAGRVLHATWSKPSATSPIRLVDDTGSVVRLAPGNSWIELVPTSGSVTLG